jgi:hypothetical protein
MSPVEQVERIDAPSRPGRVKHVFECWEREGRYPRSGDRALCGVVRREGGEADTGVPYRGNEHLACVVCLDLWWGRP